MSSAEEREFIEALASLDTMPPVTLQLTALQAWSLMATIQLACRHPGNVGSTRAMVEELARRI